MRLCDELRPGGGVGALTPTVQLACDSAPFTTAS